MGRLDRLTALDATFLNFEHPHTPMHVAGLYIFEGKPSAPGRPGAAGLFKTIEERLPEVPRFRQKIVGMPLGLAHPVWADDPDFDLSYHLRRAALPSPGGTTELLDYVARIHARPLDRRRPLWEMYIIEGLADGKIAVYNKTHHAMIDGISGVDLATVILDLDPNGRPAKEADDFSPDPVPSGLRLASGLVGDAVGGIARTAFGALSRPQRVPGAVLGSLGGATALRRLASLAVPAPESPINAPVGSARRISLVPVSLARAKAVKNALGGTVNDVVLCAVGEALNHFLEHRGVPHEEQVYRVMVPVSVRDESERMALGNRVAAMFVDLPVGSMPVRRRLHAVSAAMENLKETKQAVAADMLVGLAGWAPATLHGLAGRLEFANQRVVNTVVSNVPGVQVPMYAGGARLLEAWPLLPLSANVALVTCVTSYNGGLFFGLIGDYDVLPDLEVIADGLRRGFDRLEVAALQASRGDAALESTSLESRAGDAGNGHNGGRRAHKVVQVVEGGAASTPARTPRRKAASRSGSSPARRRQASGETDDG